MQGTLPFTLLILDLFSHYHTRCLSLFFTLRLTTCIFWHYQAHSHLFSHCQARCLFSLTLSGSYSLTIRFTTCLLSLAGSLPIYSHSHSGSLPIYSYSHSSSLPVYSHSHSSLLPAYLTLTQACCLPISLSLRLAACLFSLSLRLAACLSHSHSGSLPVYSHSHSGLLPAYLTGLLPVYSHSHSGSLPVYSHTIRLTAGLFSNYQAYCLSILTLSGYLPVYSHTHVTVYLFSHPMLLRLSSLPMYFCTLGLTAYLFSCSN